MDCWSWFDRAQTEEFLVLYVADAGTIRMAARREADDGKLLGIMWKRRYVASSSYSIGSRICRASTAFRTVLGAFGAALEAGKYIRLSAVHNPREASKLASRKYRVKVALGIPKTVSICWTVTLVFGSHNLSQMPARRSWNFSDSVVHMVRRNPPIGRALHVTARGMEGVERSGPLL